MKLLLSILGSIFISLTCYAQAGTYILHYTNNPPFAADVDGKEEGVAINIVSKLFERAELQYKFMNVPLARGMIQAKTGDGTCVFPVQRAQDIEADYQWVSPIIITHSCLFANIDSNLQLSVLSDAKQMSIGVIRGSGDAEYLKKFGFNVQEIPDHEQNFKKLLYKRIDLWATDSLSANYVMKKVGESAKEQLAFRQSLGSLACNNKIPVADIEKLQKTLDTMINDGTLQKLTAATPIASP